MVNGIVFLNVNKNCVVDVQLVGPIFTMAFDMKRYSCYGWSKQFFKLSVVIFLIINFINQSLAESAI
jgi:hypothetical protein